MDTFFNQRLLPLPELHPLPANEVKQSREEALVYRYGPMRLPLLGLGTKTLDRWVENHFRHQLNQMPDKGGAGALILKGMAMLRLAADHPMLFEGLMEKILCMGTVVSLRKSLPHHVRSTPILDMMERWCHMTRRLGSAGSIPDATTEVKEEPNDAATYGPAAEAGGEPSFPATLNISLQDLDCPICDKVPAAAYRAEASTNYISRPVQILRGFLANK